MALNPTTDEPSLRRVLACTVKEVQFHKKQIHHLNQTLEKTLERMVQINKQHAKRQHELHEILMLHNKDLTQQAKGQHELHEILMLHLGHRQQLPKQDHQQKGTKRGREEGSSQDEDEDEAGPSAPKKAAVKAKEDTQKSKELEERRTKKLLRASMNEEAQRATPAGGWQNWTKLRDWCDVWLKENEEAIAYGYTSADQLYGGSESRNRNFKRWLFKKAKCTFGNGRKYWDFSELGHETCPIYSRTGSAAGSAAAAAGSATAAAAAPRTPHAVRAQLVSQ